jgi:hypothetical protein
MGQYVRTRCSVCLIRIDLSAAKVVDSLGAASRYEALSAWFAACKVSFQRWTRRIQLTTYLRRDWTAQNGK